MDYKSINNMKTLKFIQFIILILIINICIAQPSSLNWGIKGNAGTTAGTNFIGTTDNVSLVFKTNKTEFMRLTSVGILGLGTSSPATSSIVDLTSTSKGFLAPRMSGTQMNAISSPASGLLIYNTDSAAYCYYNGLIWVKFSAGSGATLLAGTKYQIPFYLTNNTLGSSKFMQFHQPDSTMAFGDTSNAVVTSGDPPHQYQFYSAPGTSKFFMEFVMPGNAQKNFHSVSFNGTYSSPSPILTREYFLSWGMRSWVSTGFTQSAAAWQVQAAETFTTTHQGTRQFWSNTAIADIANNRKVNMLLDATGLWVSPTAINVGSITGNLFNTFSCDGSSVFGSTQVGVLSSIFEVQKNQNAGTIGSIYNSDLGNNASAVMQIGNSNHIANIFMAGTGRTANGGLKTDGMSMYTDGAGGISIMAFDGSTGDVRLYGGGLASANNGFTLDHNKNSVLNATGSALSTSATIGFTYPPVCAGNATGTPASSYTGAIPWVYNTTDHVEEIYDNSMWYHLTPILSRVSTQFDQTNNTTLANITGLTANVVSGKTYSFEANLYCNANVATGVKVAIAGTATATAITYDTVILDAGVITQPARATALGTAGGVTAVTAPYITIHGTITVNAAGTLTCQFAENAGVSLTTSSVLVGSIFSVKQIQ